MAPPRAPIRRLRRYDQHCLAAETPARPIQFGILATLDGGALVDPDGHLRLDELRRELDHRTAGVPELRRIVHRPGSLAGGPVWVDDPAFEIERHIGEAAVPPPGDEPALLALTERLMAELLDRSHPLWRLWFLTGLDGGRAGLLVIVHHALADGLTAMRLVSALLEPPFPSASGPAQLAPLVPGVAAPPRRWRLVADNVAIKISWLPRVVRPSTWRRAVAVIRAGWRINAIARRTPRTSLNAPVGPKRRLATVRLDLPIARRAAHVHGVGVNEVVLSLVAGGVRALLRARGEPVERLRPRAGIAVSLFSAGHAVEAGNDIGTLNLGLPIADPDPVSRLPAIAAEWEDARRSPFVAVEPVLRAWMGRFGWFRRTLDHQRLVNLSETYLPGPRHPIDVLGAHVTELLPVAPLSGNLGLSFVALSYAGRITIAVRADADAFPDLDVLTAAMAEDWRALAASSIKGHSATGSVPDLPKRSADAA